MAVCAKSINTMFNKTRLWLWNMACQMKGIIKEISDHHVDWHVLYQKEVPSNQVWGGQGRHLGRVDIWVHPWRKLRGNQGERKGSFQLNSKQILKCFCVWGIAHLGRNWWSNKRLSWRGEMGPNDAESCKTCW